MQIRNRLFPYPILNHNKDFSNYQNCTFELLFDEEEGDDDYILNNIRFETDSNQINELYKKNQIGIACIIECSNTVYRKRFLISTNNNQINLKKSDFYEKVVISMFAFAKEDFVISSDEFEEDYRNFNFKIEKNDIIAVHDGFEIYFKHAEEEDNIIRSIFNIIIDRNLDESEFYVEFDTTKKINVYLSTKDYENYKIIYSIPEYKEIFFSILLVPALTEALAVSISELKNETEADLDDFGNKYRWFRTIEASYERLFGKKMDVESFVKESPVQLSQQLLGKPLGSSLANLLQSTKKELAEEDQYE